MYNLTNEASQSYFAHDFNTVSRIEPCADVLGWLEAVDHAGGLVRLNQTRIRLLRAKRHYMREQKEFLG